MYNSNNASFFLTSETFTGKQKLNEKNCGNLLDRITMLFLEEKKENLIFHTKIRIPLL